MFQPVFTSHFELDLLSVLLILMFLKYIYIYAWNYQPKENSSVFKRLSECIMKLFPRGLVPIDQALRPQNPSDFRFAKNSITKLNPGYSTVGKSTVKNLLKIFWK